MEAREAGTAELAQLPEGLQAPEDGARRSAMNADASGGDGELIGFGGVELRERIGAELNVRGGVGGSGGEAVVEDVKEFGFKVGVFFGRSGEVRGIGAEAGDGAITIPQTHTLRLWEEESEYVGHNCAKYTFSGDYCSKERAWCTR